MTDLPDDVILARVRQLAEDHRHRPWYGAEDWFCQAHRQGHYCCLDFLLAPDPAKLPTGWRDFHDWEIPKFPDDEPNLTHDPCEHCGNPDHTRHTCPQRQEPAQQEAS